MKFNPQRAGREIHGQDFVRSQVGTATTFVYSVTSTSLSRFCEHSTDLWFQQDERIFNHHKYFEIFGSLCFISISV